MKLIIDGCALYDAQRKEGMVASLTEIDKTFPGADVTYFVSLFGPKREYIEHIKQKLSHWKVSTSDIRDLNQGNVALLQYYYTRTRFDVLITCLATMFRQAYPDEEIVAVSDSWTLWPLVKALKLKICFWPHLIDPRWHRIGVDYPLGKTHFKETKDEV